MRNKRKTKLPSWQVLLLAVVIALATSAMEYFGLLPQTPSYGIQDGQFSLSQIPEYSGNTGVEVNGNVPFFTESDWTVDAYEYYSDLDALGRCGTAMACLGTETMPTEDREPIGSVKPTGWHSSRYDELISDRYLYNRSHLIAFMLSGENANERNLITGTRYLNATGMLPYEDAVCDYIRQTGNHVRYRVTPIFVDTELVARGVLMEALSMEDQGQGISFCVYLYNVQPGVVIDYQTGDNWAA